MEKKTILTKEGYKKLVNELNELKKTKRPKTVIRLKKAREMGDLSENSEYVAAKEELAFIDGQIGEIEEILKTVNIVGDDPSKEIVQIGSFLEVEINGQRDNLIIVGELEADVPKKKISYTSPVGKALLGKQVDDVVEVKTPAGKTSYRIIVIK